MTHGHICNNVPGCVTTRCHVSRDTPGWVVTSGGAGLVCDTLTHRDLFIYIDVLFSVLLQFLDGYKSRPLNTRIHSFITITFIKILPSRLCYDHLGAKTEEFLPKFLRLQTTNNLRSTVRGKSLSLPICGEISSCVHRSYYTQIQL